MSNPQTTDTSNDHVCVFCMEGSFDLEGLKYHLDHYCAEYQNIQYEAAHEKP